MPAPLDAMGEEGFEVGFLQAGFQLPGEPDGLAIERRDRHQRRADRVGSVARRRRPSGRARRASACTSSDCVRVRRLSVACSSALVSASASLAWVSERERSASGGLRLLVLACRRARGGSTRTAPVRAAAASRRRLPSAPCARAASWSWGTKVMIFQRSCTRVLPRRRRDGRKVSQLHRPPSARRYCRHRAVASAPRPPDLPGERQPGAPAGSRSSGADRGDQPAIGVREHRDRAGFGRS